MRKASLACALCCLALVPPLQAVQGFPPYVTLPREVVLYDPGSLVAEDQAEVEFPLAEGKTVAQKGRHYASYLKFGPEELNRPAAATWKAWQPALAASGWVVKGNDGATTYTLVRNAEGVESWLRVQLADYDSPKIELIEKKGAVAVLVLRPPQAQAERIGPAEDFPYFSPPAGAVLSGTTTVDGPLDVTSPGATEPELAGTRYLVKTYTPPASLSRFELESTYRAALAAAGWTVQPLPAGAKVGEGQVVAHYGGNGRDLWLVAGRGADNGPTGLVVKVADVGGEDWGGRLDQSCRLPLYGLHFDTNQATLRPDSVPLLEKARAVLAARGSVAVEVQGHTDSAGAGDANLRLSAARAETVRSWLAAHGIAASRLTAKGYGEGAPRADNGTSEGRALNRRVELVRAGCKP